MRNYSRPAFTLIELLVSLALSGILIVLLNSQITNSIFTDAKIKKQIEYRLEIENVLDQVIADISSASHMTNGQKSVKFYSNKNGLQLHLNRFGISPKTQKLHGLKVIWKFNEKGISRSIDSIDGRYKRMISDKKVSAEVEEIGSDIINLIIINQNFTKSKLVEL